MIEQPFPNHRAAALALLNGDGRRFNRKAAQFLGQITLDPKPLTAKQADWLGTMLKQAGLPTQIEGGIA